MNGGKGTDGFESLMSTVAMFAGLVARGAGATGTSSAAAGWQIYPGLNNVWGRVQDPDKSDGPVRFLGRFDSVDECWAAANATDKPSSTPSVLTVAMTPLSSSSSFQCGDSKAAWPFPSCQSPAAAFQRGIARMECWCY